LPNHQLIENDFINLTRYPIRRMDFVVTVSPTEELERVIEALAAVAENVPQVMDEPAPFVMAGDFVDNGMTVRLGVWFERVNYVSVRNAIVSGIQQVFVQRNIPIRGRTIQVTESVNSGRTRLPIV
ncbi:MAG: mechanosensitive ion channel, partial [Spirochaeta sp.]|nr:mechanosensitive ion channel [Spirochaeta sp.]